MAETDEYSESGNPIYRYEEGENPFEVPQGEMLVVKRESKHNALIPFQKEFVSKIDKADNKIYIIEMEGLL